MLAGGRSGPTCSLVLVGVVGVWYAGGRYIVSNVCVKCSFGVGLCVMLLVYFVSVQGKVKGHRKRLCVVVCGKGSGYGIRCLKEDVKF